MAYLLLAAAALSITVFAAVMLPAHWQIRSVAVDIPSARELDAALDDVSADDFPSQNHFVNIAQQSGPFGELGHVGVLIHWTDGNSFLIDTGMNKAEAIAFGRPFELLGADSTRTFGAIERQLDTAVNNIRGIGLTHLHSGRLACQNHREYLINGVNWPTRSYSCLPTSLKFWVIQYTEGQSASSAFV